MGPWPSFPWGGAGLYLPTVLALTGAFGTPFFWSKKYRSAPNSIWFSSCYEKGKLTSSTIADECLTASQPGLGSPEPAGRDPLVVGGVEHCQKPSQRQAKAKPAPTMARDTGLHHLSWSIRRVSLEGLGSRQCFLLPAQGSWARLHGLLKNLKFNSLGCKGVKRRAAHTTEANSSHAVIIWEDPCVQEALVSRFICCSRNAIRI